MEIQVLLHNEILDSVARMVENFPAFCGTGRVNSLLTKAHGCSQPSASWI